jgi:hypothetical protein
MKPHQIKRQLLKTQIHPKLKKNQKKPSMYLNTLIMKKMSCQQKEKIFGAQMKRCDEEVEEDKGTIIIFMKEDHAAKRKPS